MDKDLAGIIFVGFVLMSWSGFYYFLTRELVGIFLLGIWFGMLSLGILWYYKNKELKKELEE